MEPTQARCWELQGHRYRLGWGDDDHLANAIWELLLTGGYWV